MDPLDDEGEQDRRPFRKPPHYCSLCWGFTGAGSPCQEFEEEDEDAGAEDDNADGVGG